MWAIDLLASEYGWPKHDILNEVYLDELFFLTRYINRRHITDYRMQLAIAQNPHVKNPKELWTILEQQEREITGKHQENDFDAVGFELLKNELRNNNKFIVK